MVCAYLPVQVVRKLSCLSSVVEIGMRLDVNTSTGRKSIMHTLVFKKLLSVDPFKYQNCPLASGKLTGNFIFVISGH